MYFDLLDQVCKSASSTKRAAVFRGVFALAHAWSHSHSFVLFCFCNTLSELSNESRHDIVTSRGAAIRLGLNTRAIIPTRERKAENVYVSRIFFCFASLYAEFRSFGMTYRKIRSSNSKERTKEVLIQPRTDMLWSCIVVRNSAKIHALRLVFMFSRCNEGKQDTCATY